MKKLVPVFSLALLLTIAPAKAQYILDIKTGQTYTEIVNPTYTIPDNSQYWGNVNTRVDMYFTSHGSQYDLYDYVYIPIKQGYAYFINATLSTTLYCARGLFDGRPGDNQLSEFSYKLDSVGGQQVYTMQWKNVGFKNGDSSDFINFQLKLFGNTGVVEMHFGPNSVKNGLWEDGQNGPTIGLLEMDNSFSTIYNRMWLTGNAQSPTISHTGTFLQLDNVPTPGTVYRFLPVTAGIGELSSKKPLKIYPTLTASGNPIRIETFGTTGKLGVKLFNSLGQMVYEGVMEGNQTDLPTTGLAPGIYSILAEENGVPLYTEKVVISQ